MAISNQERVGKAMELLRAGLAPFVECELKGLREAAAADVERRHLGDERGGGKDGLVVVRGPLRARHAAPETRPSQGQKTAPPVKRPLCLPLNQSPDQSGNGRPGHAVRP